MNDSTSVCALRRPLHIAVVTETYPPEINGVARTVGLMVEALLERGHSIELVRPRQETEPASPPHPLLSERLVRGVPIPNYDNLQLGFMRASTLARAWRERRPSLVHVVTEGPLGWAATSAASSLGIPVCSDFHTNFHSYSTHYGFGLLGGAVAWYLRLLHNRCFNTIVPTAALARELEELGFQRLAVVGRGIDCRLFDPARRSGELRRQWGCSDAETVVLYVGRLAPEKNLTLFVEGAEAMRHNDPSIRVVLVGDGPEGPRLRERHPDYVFAGMRTGNDLAAHYASADVFLFPSMTETFGNVTLEALASGLALVAFEHAAARRHVLHAVSGLLAPFGDRPQFIAFACMLAQDAGLRESLRSEARRAAQCLSWDRVFDDLETLLLQAVLQNEQLPGDFQRSKLIAPELRN